MSGSWTRGAAVLILLALVNAAAQAVHWRLDLSAGRVYSIGAASRRVLRGLGEPVTVTLYASKELPAEIRVAKTFAVDLLKEYASAAGGRVLARSVAVGEDKASEREASHNGITRTFFDIIAKDHYEQRQGFLGLTMQYRGKKEVIGYLPAAENLEYELTAKIKALSSAAKPVVGFVSSYQAVAAEKLDASALQELAARYDLRDVVLSSAASRGGIPAEIKTLFFIGPQSPVSARDAAVLQRYLESGRSLCLALDTKRIYRGGYAAMPLETGLDALLKAQGLRLLPAIVLDEQSMTVQVSQPHGAGALSNGVHYPPILLVKDFDKLSPLTQGLDSLILPFASPIEITNDGASRGAVVLARSSRLSWMPPLGTRKSREQKLYPFQIEPQKPDDVPGPFPLIAAVSRPARLVLIGTSKFAGTPDFRLSEANESFFLNLADWLSQDEDLIAIRSKTVSFRGLNEVPPAAKTLIRGLDLFLPPLAALLIGLARWEARRRARRRAQVRYGPASAANAA